MGEAFAGESFTLDQWALRRGVALHRLENLNSAECGGLLEGLGADLGIVIGTRILKRSTFAKPRLGSLNLHKGKVPEYRGMPPGFWEIYDRAQSAGVTVHFVDDGLDTGNIVATAELGIRQTETPDTLRRKMDEAGARLMAEAVAKVRDGETQGQRQPSGKWPLRTRPTRLQVLELSRRGGALERLAKALPYEIVKRVFYLLLWKLGVVELMRRLGRKPQAAILLYHRVDDFSDDPLTISRRGFAEHLSVLKRFYTVRSSVWLVEHHRIGADRFALL